MLGLLPLGGRVLNQLDSREAYFARSLEMQRYEIHREDGSLIKSYDLDFISREYGSYRGIARTELIDILLQSVDLSSIRFGVTVKGLQQLFNKVALTFSDGSEEFFDLVVVADGLHSSTRDLVLWKDRVSYYDTHWGGWTAWLEEQSEPVYREYWGAASFMGLYPVQNKVGVFVGGPREHIEDVGFQDFISQERRQLAGECTILHRALEALAEAPAPFLWKFQDCRADHWVKGNVVLLGDAACGFLPTAGAGASMAMDSAAALVDELSRSDTTHLDYALKLYQQRQEEKVQKAQQDSRDLGKMMFVRSPVIAAVRNYAVRFYSLEALVKNISRTIEGR